MNEGMSLEAIDDRLKVLEDANKDHVIDLMILKTFLKAQLQKENQIESSISALDSMYEIYLPMFEGENSGLERFKSHIEAFKDLLSDPT